MDRAQRLLLPPDGFAIAMLQDLGIADAPIKAGIGRDETGQLRHGLDLRSRVSLQNGGIDIQARAVRGRDPIASGASQLDDPRGAGAIAAAGQQLAPTHIDRTEIGVHRNGAFEAAHDSRRIRLAGGFDVEPKGLGALRAESGRPGVQAARQGAGQRQNAVCERRAGDEAILGPVGSDIPQGSAAMRNRPPTMETYPCRTWLAGAAPASGSGGNSNGYRRADPASSLTRTAGTASPIQSSEGVPLRFSKRETAKRWMPWSVLGAQPERKARTTAAAHARPL